MEGCGDYEQRFNPITMKGRKIAGKNATSGLFKTQRKKQRKKKKNILFLMATKNCDGVHGTYVSNQ